MISQRAKYALRALLALARADEGQSVAISEIAETQSIPKKFLEQILLELKRHGIVDSRRGKEGGYLMRRNADEVTYGEILRIIDGPLALLPKGLVGLPGQWRERLVGRASRRAEAQGEAGHE